MPFVKDWIFWVQSCLDSFPSVYLGSLFPDNLRRCSAESLQGDGPCSGEGTNYTWENWTAQVGPVEEMQRKAVSCGGAGISCGVWCQACTRPAEGIQKLLTPFFSFWKWSDHRMTCNAERICWHSRHRDQDAHLGVSVGNPLGSLAEEKHRISALAARPKFLLIVLFGFCPSFPEVVEVISHFHGWI